MKFRFKHAAAAAIAGLILSTAPSANATLTFTGGIADLTFYYESQANDGNGRWDIVFRNKGNTVATGNDTSYVHFPGIVGNEPANDKTFNQLQINVSSAPLYNVGGTNYLITPASGSGLYSAVTHPVMAAENPDLGFRFRLREDLGEGVVNQFVDVRTTLDWNASTKPLGAEFVMLDRDNLSVRIGTESGPMSFDVGHYAHNHFHFGFSQVGDYSLVFNVEGIDGLYGDNSSSGTVTLNFSVIPEPSTALLSMLAIGALGLRRRRN